MTSIRSVYMMHSARFVLVLCLLTCSSVTGDVDDNSSDGNKHVNTSSHDVYKHSQTGDIDETKIDTKDAANVEIQVNSLNDDESESNEIEITNIKHGADRQTVDLDRQNSGVKSVNSDRGSESNKNTHGDPTRADSDGSNEAADVDATKAKQDCPQLNKFINCFSFAEVIDARKTGSYLQLTLNTFNRTLALQMQRGGSGGGGHRSVIKSTTKIILADTHGTHTQLANLHDYYYGYIEGRQASTKAHGRYNGKLFLGTVKTRQEVLNFEPATRYFNGSRYATLMIAYRDTDLNPVNTTRDTMYADDISDSATHSDISAKPPLLHRNASRYRRQTVGPPDPMACPVAIVVDHTYWDFVTGDIDDAEKVLYMQADVVFHMEESTDTFSDTDFNGDGYGEAVGFVIDRITIFQTTDAADYTFAAIDPDSHALLRTFSSYDFSDVCLGVLFIRRDFERGVLGLAWVGSSNPLSSSGGICSRRSGGRNYNTLLMTNINYGATVPTRVHVLTTIHEFGHSFGSNHDQAGDSECTPGGSRGNFIMSPTASDATRPNNYFFSSCSKSMIAPVIEFKGPVCFRDDDEACGNFIVEDGEECDCGRQVNQCVDPCCERTTCQLASSALCTPQVDECCTSSCQTMTDTSHVCREAEDCTLETMCDGTNSQCPAATPISTQVSCRNGQRVCNTTSGLCEISACQSQGNTQECLCETDSERCELCCENSNGDCVTAFSLGIMHNSARIQLDVGQACFEGYCDQSLECVFAGALDILDELDASIDRTAYRIFADFMADYWFLLIILVGTIIGAIGSFLAYRFTGKVGSIGHHTRDEITSLIAEAEDDIKEFDRLIEKLHRILDERNARMQHQDYSGMGVVKSITRLKEYFPHSEHVDLLQVKKTTRNEQEAVETLVRANHPMMQLPESESTTSFVLNTNITLTSPTGPV